MTDLQFVIAYSTVLVLLLAFGSRADRLIRDWWAARSTREFARRRVVAMLPQAAPEALTSPLLVRADALVDQLLVLYREGAAQGYFLELRVGGFDAADVETLKLPLVRVNWRRASTTEPAGKRVDVNPINPGQ